MKQKSFCAANSGDGFISLFDTILNEKENRIFYIKGGPGCGKSTLMKEVAEQNETAEELYCSGDPKSLDGIMLPEKKTILIDATAPHSYEPIYPAVGGSIINLGAAWIPQNINKARIIELMEKKSEVYKKCYALLRAAKNLHSGIFLPLISNLSIKKLQIIGDKILRQNALWESRAKEAKISHRFFSGITADGLVTLSETLAASRNVIAISDRWMIGNCILSYLEEQLKKRGIDHMIGYHPLIGKGTIQQLIIPEVSLTIASADSIFPLDIPEEKIVKKISLQRLLDTDFLNENKNKLTFFKRLLRELLEASVSLLEQARSIHLEIEAEYAKGIDYSITQKMKEDLMNIL